MEKSTVLFFSEVNWDYLRQRHHFFAENYSKKGHKVIYIGKIGLRYPNLNELFSFFKRSKNQKITYHSKTYNIDLYKGFFLPPINILFNYLNKMIFLPRLLKYIEVDNLIIHVYQPTQLFLSLINKLEKLNIQVQLVYDCVQDYRFHPSHSKKILEIEKILVLKSNVVVADSKVNFDRLAKSNKFLVPPGVDVEFFKVRNERSYESEIRHIIYYGNIRKDLDISLINKISESKKIEITLIGLLNIDRNKFNPRVKILNSVEYQKLPSIIKLYDALILPYDIENPFTKAIIPAKFFECLCTGLPILSTKMESTREYHEYLTIVSNKTDFDNLQINYLNTKAVQTVEALINQSSWEKRFEIFYSEVE